MRERLRPWTPQRGHTNPAGQRACSKGLLTGHLAAVALKEFDQTQPRLELNAAHRRGATSVGARPLPYTPTVAIPETLLKIGANLVPENRSVPVFR